MIMDTVLPSHKPGRAETAETEPVSDRRKGRAAMGIHDGHRDRVKQEFLQGGLEHFSEVRALELLLFYSRRQGDVNPTAHALLDAFGSLSAVLDAPTEELVKVEGVGENTAILLKLIPAMAARYLDSRNRAETFLTDADTLRARLVPYFFGAKNERSAIACFDSSQKLLRIQVLSEGSPTATDLNLRQIAGAALSVNASAVVLAHNHPSGNPAPSDEDLSTTRYLWGELKKLDVVLFDHVILTDGDMFSIRDSGYFRTFFV